MDDIQVLKTLGISTWSIRDMNLFKHYKKDQNEVRYSVLQGDLNTANPVLIVISYKQKFTKLVKNFCKYLLIGYNSKVVVLQQSSKGEIFDELIETNKPSYIISFVEFQEDTSNLNNNVLILNNINLDKLETSISYKKQVLLDVLRMSIPSLRDK